MFKALMRNGDEDDEAVHVCHNLTPAEELTIFAPFHDVFSQPGHKNKKLSAVLWPWTTDLRHSSPYQQCV
jgi:hypothetical protein